MIWLGGGVEVYFRTDFYVTKYLYHLTSAIDSYSFPVLRDMCTIASGVWIAWQIAWVMLIWTWSRGVRSSNVCTRLPKETIQDTLFVRWDYLYYRDIRLG